ncbi:MAG: nitroreductase [Flavobacteriaceae bacterium]|nr:nitroreductase [Flavobacteriaceae bacterium]
MVLSLIKSRRTLYPQQFNEEPISESELHVLLEATNWAPTHKKTEPWRFKVFTGDAKDALGAFLTQTYKDITENASEFKCQRVLEKSLRSQCVLAVCMVRDPKGAIPEWEEIAATAMAVQNLWLTAHDMKIGGYWSSPSVKDYLHEHIQLGEGERCLGFFYLGKYDGDLPKGNRNSNYKDKISFY